MVGKKVKWAGDCSILVGVGGEGREYIESLRGYKTPSNPDVKPSMYFGTGGTKKQFECATRSIIPNTQPRAAVTQLLT